MKQRLVAAVALTIISLAVPKTPTQANGGNDLIVHEWGTFTSIAGPDGSAIEWAPQTGPQDLPCFVDRLSLHIKGWLPGKVRMETPVLYFYAPREMTANVSVRFRQGIVTEWYPNAAVTPTSVTAATLRSLPFESSITWRDVKIAPGNTSDFPVDGRESHYYAARATDASPLESNRETEKFLFYRGVGGFEPPLMATVDQTGNIVVASPAGEAIGDVILFENRGGAIAYELAHAGASRITFYPLTPSDEFSAPLGELEALLVAHGLYSKEAAAMIETWRDSWFDEGARLFYFASREDVDAILPLAVTPPPSAVERVFVGRIELVTPTTEARVRDAIARNDRAALRPYARFVDAILGGSLAKTTAVERARTQPLLQAIYASSTTVPATCR